MSLEGRRSSAIEWPEINLDEWLDKCPDNEPDSTFDESDIEAMASGRTRLMEPEMSKTYKFAVDRYTEIGLPHDMMNRKLGQFDDYLNECLTIIHKVVDGEYNKFVEYKENLMAKIRKMRKDLYLPTVDDNENYPLVQLCKRLRRKFNELNVVKQERMTKLKELRDQQSKHCQVLGIKTPEIKMQTDIPTREELDCLSKAVLDLAHEETKRKTKYSTLIETISKCMDQIDYHPKDDFEMNVLSAKPIYTEDYLSRLSNFHSSLEKQFVANQNKYEKLKSRLESLYDRLDVDDEVRKDFFDTHSICKPKVMAEMEEEIEEYEEMKRQNIGKFIDKIKTELKTEYERCYVSEETQEKFLSLTNDSDDCNEQLLELCENELRRIKDYYEVNKSILQKISRWKEMFAELIDLEKKASDPNRFQNRGGQLLREEKQRKTLQRGLPKIEEELRQMNENVKFKIFDSDLDQFIDDCWDELRNVKEVEKRERLKAKNDPNKTRKPPQSMKTPTKRACGPGITPTPQKLQRTALGTPSNRPNLMGGMSGSVKKNNISRSQLPNSRSNIPVASSGQVSTRDKTISSSNVSDLSDLSVNEQEFQKMLSGCPTSAKRR